jgi:ribosomal protein L16 Arg81 hydroxylase
VSELELLAATPEELAELRWGAAPHRFTASKELREAATDDDLDDWLDASLLHVPFFNVLHRGVDVAPEDVTSARIIDGQARPGYIDGDKVRGWLAKGGTASIAYLHQWHRPLRTLCRAIAERTSTRVGASAFVTGAGAPGLRVHRDDTHVVVAQVSGRKRWYLYDVPDGAAAWRPGYTERELPQPTSVVELAPGDALYVPEGMAHHAEAMANAPSFHVSLTINEPRIHDAIDLAVAACLASIPDHASLGSSSTQREEAARRILARLASTLPRVDVRALVAALERRTVDRARR